MFTCWAQVVLVGVLELGLVQELVQADDLLVVQVPWVHVLIQAPANLSNQPACHIQVLLLLESVQGRLELSLKVQVERHAGHAYNAMHVTPLQPASSMCRHACVVLGYAGELLVQELLQRGALGAGDEPLNELQIHRGWVVLHFLHRHSNAKDAHGANGLQTQQ